MYPTAERAISVNRDCGHVLEKKAKDLNHEIFSRRLWASYSAFMVTACSNHVARGAIRWSPYQFTNKDHVPHSNHITDAGDGVEHSSHFVVVKLLLANCGH